MERIIRDETVGGDAVGLVRIGKIERAFARHVGIGATGTAQNDRAGPRHHGQAVVADRVAHKVRVAIAAAILSGVARQVRSFRRVHDIGGVEEGLFGKVRVQGHVEQAAILSVIDLVTQVEDRALPVAFGIEGNDEPVLLRDIDET